jgi:hypothetical protein
MPILGIIASSKLGAPATAFESIASVTGDGSATTLTFSSIPATFKHLQIRGISRRASGTGIADISIRLNSDTGSNYAYHLLQGNGSAVAASGSASQTSILWSHILPGTNQAASSYGAGIADIHDYASATKNKTLRLISGFESNAASTGDRIYLSSGLWMDTSAITSISLISADAFDTSSNFALYGIKGA